MPRETSMPQGTSQQVALAHGQRAMAQIAPMPRSSEQKLDLNKTIARNVRALLAAHGWTPNAFARMIGVNAPSFIRALREAAEGGQRGLGVDVLAAIHRAGFSVDALMDPRSRFDRVGKATNRT